MEKPRYRYDWAKGEWDQIIRFNTNVVVSDGIIDPRTGLYRKFELPRDHPLRKAIRRLPGKI